MLLASMPTVLASSWADRPTTLSIAEYVQLQLQLALHRHEAGGRQGGNYIAFLPAKSPSTALVLIVQAWDVDGLDDAQVRGMIRDGVASNFGLVRSLLKSPLIRSRWTIDPDTQVLVRHVRKLDWKETIAVSVGDHTLFDPESIAKSKTLVMSAGPWAWED